MIEFDDIHAEPVEDEPVFVPLVKRKGVGRNDLCPCHSGKKYKHCHEKADKLLLPVEMHRLLQILLSMIPGITIYQKTFDDFKDIEVQLLYDEHLRAWKIFCPKRPKQAILVPSKRPVLPVRN
jgi:hypothetical protein